jgi:DNA invertase Pin-like site-specific DNA recombinase
MRSIDERLAEAKDKLIKAQGRYDRLLAIKNGSTIDKRIEQIRKEKHLSYSEISRRMGVSRQRVYKIFEKPCLSSTMVGRLAKALEVSTDEIIFGGADDENS